jgi:hypothetical protein
LGDLYSAPNGDDLLRDFATGEARTVDFEKHRGKIAGMDGAAFGAAIAEYEAISEILGKIASYAQLYQSGDVSSPERGRFYQDTVERLTVLNGKLLFFTLEINRLEGADLAVKMKHPTAAHYAPWVRDLRVMREHELSDDLERLFLDKSTTGRTAWVTNGPSADAIIVFAVTTENLGRKRYSAFLVPRGTPGMTTEDMPGYHALRPSKHCLLTLDNVRVPASAIVGSSGAMAERCGVVTASATTLPLRAGAMAVGMVSNIIAMRPAIMSGMAAPPPL